MIGFVLRLLACLILAGAAAFAIGDIARSLSVEGLRLTSVSEAVGYFSAQDWAPAMNGSADLGGGTLLSLMSGWPVSPTLAAIAFLILLIGRRRPERAHLR